MSLCPFTPLTAHPTHLNLLQHRPLPPRPILHRAQKLIILRKLVVQNILKRDRRDLRELRKASRRAHDARADVVRVGEVLRTAGVVGELAVEVV